MAFAVPIFSEGFDLNYLITNTIYVPVPLIYTVVCTSKEGSKISIGVMFLIIAILVIFTEVCGNPLFVTWKHAQVFIYDNPKFYEMKRAPREDF